MSLYTMRQILLLLIGILVHTVGGQHCDIPRLIDGQFSASSSYSIYTADQARLSGIGWVPAPGTLNQYLHLDLRTTHTVIRYTLKGVEDIGSWYVRRFSLYYSQDGVTWERYVNDTWSSVLPGNTNSRNSLTVDLTPSIEARYLVFQPKEGQGLRLELYGCETDQQDNVTFTIVSENIEDAREWILSESPYIINSEILIKASGQLKIHPGVKVIFNSTDAGFLVNGRLEAAGANDLPVEFGYPRPFSRQANQWAGLEVTDHGNLTLEHCNIYGTVTGVRGPLGSIAVRHCHIHQNNIGLELTAGDSATEMTLTDTRVANNSRHGILINDWSTENVIFYMKDCQIVENGESGLGFDRQITLHADNCVFSDNMAHGISNYNDSGNGVNITLNKCSLSNNHAHGFHLDFTSFTSDSDLHITVSEAEINNNKEKGMLTNLYHPPRGMSVTVRDSLISSNKDHGISIRFDCDEENGRVNLINNTFVLVNPERFVFSLGIDGVSSGASAVVSVFDNTFIEGLALWLTSTKDITYRLIGNNITTSSNHIGDIGLRISGSGGNITLYDNLFVNCTIDTVVSTDMPVRINRNVFINPDAKTDVHIGYNNEEDGRFDATENYWGSSDKFYVRSRICDFFCDMQSVIAEIHPFYTTENLTELSTDMDSDLFSFQSADTIGGILTESVTLGPDLLLFVNRSIYIPQSHRLTILENVTMVFPFLQGILVQGTVEILGTEEKKVSLVPGKTNSFWNGLKILSTGSAIKHAWIVRSNDGVYIGDSNGPMTLTITDTVFSGGHTAIRTHLNFDTELTLHNIEISYTRSAPLLMLMSKQVTASVLMSHCRIESTTGILFDSRSGGHYNISLINSRVVTGNDPCIRAPECNTQVTMVVENTTLHSRQAPVTDVVSWFLSVRYRQVMATGEIEAVKMQVCSVTESTGDSGIIDIRDSIFRVFTNKYALDIHTVNENNYPDGLQNVELMKNVHYHLSHDIILENNTFSTMPFPASIFTEIAETSSSWNIRITRNTFENSGIEINGSISNATIDQNIFHEMYTVVLSLTLLGNESSLATVSHNRVGGGTLILDSERYTDTFHIEKNDFSENQIYITTSRARLYDNNLHGGSVVFLSQEDVDVHDIQLNTFNGSQVFIMNPNVILQRNRFYTGPPLSLLFGSNCYAERQINCSLNYWGTSDEDEIASRIQDSKNDNNLPVINFIPFYGLPDLTDLQYPIESFISTSGTIGGSIGGRVTLTSAGSPYTVTDNILVGKMDTLVIEAGVVLLFPKDMGITVEGTLRILGTAEQSVVAQPLVPGEKWTGVKLLKTIYRPESTADHNIRVVDGCEGKEGRLEVRQDDKWGTVCGDGFDQKDAKVVCRILGYDPTIDHEIFYTGEFGHGSGEILMGKLACDGTETSLDECPMSEFNCSHQEDVAVRCNGKLLPTRQESVNNVELRHFLMEHTEHGLELNGNVTAVEDVNSTHSNTHGIVIYQGITGMSPFSINGMVASSNRYSGLAFETSVYLNKNRYLDIIISKGYMLHNGEYGIHILYSVNMSLISCTLEDNTESAVYLKSEAKIDVSRSKFARNQRGVFNMNELKRFNGSLHFSLRDSQVVNNVAKDHARIFNVLKFFPVVTESCSYNIANNVFSDNNGNLIFLNTHRSSVKNTLHVTNNTFQRNSNSIVMLKSPNRNSVQFHFSNNTADNNTASSLTHLLKIDIVGSLSEVVYGYVGISLFKNVFKDNTALELVRVWDVSGIQTDLNITHNIFTNNTISTALAIIAYRPVVMYNIFENTLATCELESPTFVRGYEIDARLNYWGSQDVHDVVSRVCGFDTDMSRGFIHYLPFYLSKHLTDDSDHLHTHFWIENLHGGVVDSEVHLNSTGSPYHIRRSIYIRGKGVLNIGGGAVLRFQSQTGIYVDGILLVGGRPQERVTMTRENEDTSWYGITLPYQTVGVSKTVQLVGGLTPNEGRVELCNKGSWSTVCNMNYTDSQLICHALGYGRMVQLRRNMFDEGSGPILNDLGCDNALSLTQCQPQETKNTSTCDHEKDFGVVCRHFVALTGSHDFSYLKDLSILGSKEGLLIQTPTVRLSNCHINNTEKAGLTLDTDAIHLDLNGTVVEYGKSDGIVVKVTKKLRLLNGATRYNEGKGLTVPTPVSKAVIENIDFVNNSLHYGTETSSDSISKRLQISNSTFEGQDSELVLAMNMNTNHDTDILVENNQFSNNKDPAMALGIMEGRESTGIKKLFIRGNKFMSTSPISLTSHSNLSVYIEDNIMKDNTAGDKCFLFLDMQGSHYDRDHTISISANYFENIHGKCVVHLKSTNYNFTGSFDYNRIFNSAVNKAVLLVESRQFTFSYNLFDNPTSTYEMEVLVDGEGSIKAENNWWGGETPATVGTRISDKQSKGELLAVDVTPVLTQHDFNCSGAENCNENGECVEPNGCWCDRGWTGFTCSDYDCSDMYNCNGNGNCVGPSLCNCSSGWEGRFCEVIKNDVIELCPDPVMTSPSTSTLRTTAPPGTVPVSGSISVFTMSSYLLCVTTLLIGVPLCLNSVPSG